jgi:hypothetical protein
MLTIIIASYNRENYLKQILNDIIASKGFNKIKVILVLYNNIDYLSNSFFSKVTKFNNIKIIKDKEDISGAERFIKNVKKSKTKFTWYFSDDDRIFINLIDKILPVLKKNYDLSGLSISYLSKKDNQINNKKFYFKKKKLKLTDFNIDRDYETIGLISSHIYNTELLKKFFIKKNFDYINAYTHTNFLLSNLNNWKVIKDKLVIFRVGNLDNKNFEKRLNYEFQYFTILRKNFKKKYNTLFEKFFFKHLISWIHLNTRFNGILSTLRILYINKRLIRLNIKILLTLLLILLLPNFLLEKLNTIRKYKN